MAFVVTWEKADLLARLYVKFSCVFVTFTCSVLGQVWYLIVLIPDLCLLNFYKFIPFATFLKEMSHSYTDSALQMAQF